MNEPVRNAIEELFSGYPCTRDNVELKDELLCDLSERFEDDLAAGLSREEALERMRDSLEDIRQLLGQRGAPARASGQGAEEVRFAVKGEGIRRLCAQLQCMSLVIERVSGGQVLVGYEGDEADFSLVHHRLEGDTLTLWEEKGDFLTNIARLINMRSGLRLHLGIPQGLILDYDVRSLSGSIMGNVPMITGRAESLSGKVRLECSGHVAQLLEVKSKSGGVAVRCDARTLKAESMSGKVEVEGWFDQADLGSISGAVRFSGHAGRLVSEQTSGGCHLEGSFGTVQARGVSGSVSLSCQAAPESVKARTVSGRIAIQLPQSVSAIMLDAKSLSGKVKSAFPAGEGPRIQAQSTSGSISVTA